MINNSQMGGGQPGFTNGQQEDWYSEQSSTTATNPQQAPQSLSPNSVWNPTKGGASLHQRGGSIGGGGVNQNQGVYGGGGGAPSNGNGGAYYDQRQTNPYSQQQAAGGIYGASGGGGGAQANYYGGGGGGEMDMDMNNAAKYGNKANYNGSGGHDEDYENELPLLEELGVNLHFVWLKFLIVVFPNKDIGTLSQLSKLSFSAFSKMIMKTGLGGGSSSSSRSADGGYSGLGIGSGSSFSSSSSSSTTTNTVSAFPPDFDSDMAGPVIAFLALASMMLLAGKVNFGYIYGFSVCGCALLHTVLELMYVPRAMQQQQQQTRGGGGGGGGGSSVNMEVDSSSSSSNEWSLSIWETASALGYALIPVIFLAFLNIFVSLSGVIGLLLSAGACAWATFSATRLFDTRMELHRNQQFVLVAFPTALFYSVFCLITIF